METGLANLFSRGAKDAPASGTMTELAGTGLDVGSDGWARVYHTVEGPHINETGAETPAPNEKAPSAGADPALSPELKAVPNGKSSSEAGATHRVTHPQDQADSGEPSRAKHELASGWPGAISALENELMSSNARPFDKLGDAAPRPRMRQSDTDGLSGRHEQFTKTDVDKKTGAPTAHSTEIPNHELLVSGPVVERPLSQPGDMWRGTKHTPNRQSGISHSGPDSQAVGAASENAASDRPPKPAQESKSQTTTPARPPIAGEKADPDDTLPGQLSGPSRDVGRTGTGRAVFDPLTTANRSEPHAIPHKANHVQSIELAAVHVRSGVHMESALDGADTRHSRAETPKPAHAPATQPNGPAGPVEAKITGTMEPKSADTPVKAATAIPAEPVEKSLNFAATMPVKKRMMQREVVPQAPISADNARQLLKNVPATDAIVPSKHRGTRMSKGLEFGAHRGGGDGFPRSPVWATSGGEEFAQKPVSDMDIWPREAAVQRKRPTPPAVQSVVSHINRPQLIVGQANATTSERFVVQPAMQKPGHAPENLVINAEDPKFQETTAQSAAGSADRANPLSATTTAVSGAFGRDKVAPLIQQMTAQLKTIGSDEVEITLSPKELGSVRMVLSSTESGMLLSLSLERAETHELIKRHIDLAEKMFRELGVADLSIDLSLGQNRPQSQSEENDDAGHVPAGEGRSVARIGDTPLNVTVPTIGLDIRV